MATLAFNAESIKPYEEFTPVPAGEYLVIATASEIKWTKAGTGQYLEVTMSIIEGQYKGRTLWDRITLDNPNAKAVEIGQRQLSGLCHAAGVLNVQDSAQLHNIPVIAKVSYEEDTNYGARNNIKSYKSASAPKEAAPPKPATAKPAQAPRGAMSAPWQQQPAKGPTAGIDDDIPF